MSGFACFIFSLLVTCICIGLTYVMERSDFYQHYYVQLAENQNAPVDDRPLGERIIAVVKETFNIYLNFGLSVWNYILITFINFTATLCVFPAVCTLASSYEYENSKLSLFNKQIIHTNSTIWKLSLQFSSKIRMYLSGLSQNHQWWFWSWLRSRYKKCNATINCNFFWEIGGVKNYAMNIRYLLRFFNCLAHPNLSGTFATDEKWPLSHLRISYQSLAECH